MNKTPSQKDTKSNTVVSSASAAAAQASENERRRKQTMERAKAVHLSRQLQMRLQYARLKVEHGWQKQNLNEVENLYFHHSHLRGPKPFPASSIIATHHHATSFVGPSTNSVQSSLSFKLATPSLGRSSINESSSQGYDQSKNLASIEDANAAQQPCPVNDHAISYDIDPSLGSKAPDLMEVSIFQDTNTTLSLPTSPCQTATDHPLPLGDQIDAISLPSAPRNSKSPVDLTPKLANPHPKPQRGRPQKAAPKMPPTLSTKDMFNFSSSNLTYDSFWSSHTGPTTSQMARGLYGDGIVDIPAFQVTPSDYNNGVATIIRPSSNSTPIAASNNIILQPNPDCQRNFGVPT